MTLYSMMKIWLEAFWKPHPDNTWRAPADAQITPAVIGVSSLALVTLWVGLFPEALVGFANDAAAALQGSAP